MMVINSDSNTFNIQFEHRPAYLFAYISGKAEIFGISKQSWYRIAEECKNTSCEKLLVVEDVEKAVSLAEIFEVSSEIPQLFPGVRIAFVDKNTEHHKLNEFRETVATNRGAYKKVFTTIEAAEEWLLS